MSPSQDVQLSPSTIGVGSTKPSGPTCCFQSCSVTLPRSIQRSEKRFVAISSTPW
jgi:hypothetical protein